MALRGRIASMILQNLERFGPCTPDELVQRLPTYTWNQVFAAVDQLCRDGRLTLRRPSRFQYLISRSPAMGAGRRHSAA